MEGIPEPYTNGLRVRSRKRGRETLLKDVYKGPDRGNRKSSLKWKVLFEKDLKVIFHHSGQESDKIKKGS